MTNNYFLARIAGRDPHLRAGDADRELIAERLRTSQAEGRLDLSEFQQRLERCYEAKTLGELDTLVSDLPDEARHYERRSFGWSRAWRWPLVPLIPLLLVLIVISTATGHQHHASWLWIPLVLLFWSICGRRRMRWSASARRSST